MVPNFEHASEIQNLGIYFPGNQSKSCHFVQPFSNLILTAIRRLSTCIHSVEILKKANLWILREINYSGFFNIESYILTILKVMNSDFCEFLYIFEAKIIKMINPRTLKR